MKKNEIKESCRFCKFLSIGKDYYYCMMHNRFFQDEQLDSKHCGLYENAKRKTIEERMPEYIQIDITDIIK